MEAMVLQLEPPSQSRFESFGPWRQEDVLSQIDSTSVAVRVAFLGNDIPALKGQLSAPVPSDFLKAGSTIRASSSPYPAASMLSTMRFAPPMLPPNKSLVLPSPDNPSGGPQQTATPTPVRSTSVTDVCENLVMSLGAGKDLPGLSVSDVSSSMRSSSKRRRPDSDVDGPGTAALASKKRRLRRHLITSRLSQPFSFPASHILSREAVVVGNKRSLQVSALIAARRLSQGSTPSASQNPASSNQPQPTQHLSSSHPLPTYSNLNSPAAQSPPSQPLRTPPQPHPQQFQAAPDTLLRRAAILNRFRLRVVREAVSRGDKAVVQVAGNAALLNQAHHGLGSAWHLQYPGKQNDTGTQMSPDNLSALAPAAPARGSALVPLTPFPPKHAEPGPMSAKESPALKAQAAFAHIVRGDATLSNADSVAASGSEPPNLPLRLQPHASYPHLLSRAGNVHAGPSPPTSPKALRPVDTATPGLRLPPSPRLRPLLQHGHASASRSRGCRGDEDIDGDIDEDLDDDGDVAFPTSVHESRYDSSDEPDDVYADFSVIFGGPASLDEDMDDEDAPLRTAGTGEEASAPGYEDYLDELDGIPWGAR